MDAYAAPQRVRPGSLTPRTPMPGPGNVTPIRSDVAIPEPGGLEEMLRGLDTLEPKYPAWLYKTDSETGMRELNPPPMPEAGRFNDWITADELLWADFLRRYEQDLRIYRQLDTGVFPQFSPDSDAYYISTEPTVQVNKIAAMIAGSPITVTYPWRNFHEREAASRMESFALWFLERWQTYHRQGNSELGWDMSLYALIAGRVAVLVSCDLDDGDYPWWVELLDPATVFPVWGKGKHGMLRCSRRYAVTVGDVLDEFDPDGSSDLADKIAAKREKGSINDVDLTQEGDFTECITRWHRYCAFDGIEIMRTAHEYGEVNVIYNLAPGEPGSASSPASAGTGLTASDIKRGFGGKGTTSRQRDQAQKGQSFYHPVKAALRQREKVLALHMLSMEQTVNPATNTTTPYSRPPEPMDFTPGKPNYRRPGEVTQPANPSPAPLQSDVLLQNTAAELRKGLLPDVIFGATEGSNISGFASDSLMAAAKDRIQPYFSIVEATYVDALMLAGRLFYNHGHTAEGLVHGELVVPRQNRGGRFNAGASPAPVPPWAGQIIQKAIQMAQQPGGPFGPPTAAAGGPPGGGGMIGSDVPGAPPDPRTQMGMGAGSPLLGMPGFIEPKWTMNGRVPPHDEAEAAIDRKTLDMISGRPKLTLNSLGLNNRTILINYLTQAVNANLMPRSIAMDQLPEIQDTLEAWQQIMAEQAMTNPNMLNMIYYPRSLWEQGDVESWSLYWAMNLLPQLLQLGQPAPPPGAGTPAQPKGQAPIEQPARGAPAINPAMLGEGPGSDGAPVGAPGGTG